MQSSKQLRVFEKQQQLVLNRYYQLGFIARLNNEQRIMSEYIPSWCRHEWLLGYNEADRAV